MTKAPSMLGGLGRGLMAGGRSLLGGLGRDVRGLSRMPGQMATAGNMGKSMYQGLGAGAASHMPSWMYSLPAQDFSEISHAASNTGVADRIPDAFTHEIMKTQPGGWNNFVPQSFMPGLKSASARKAAVAEIYRLGLAQSGWEKQAHLALARGVGMEKQSSRLLGLGMRGLGKGMQAMGRLPGQMGSWAGSAARGLNRAGRASEINFQRGLRGMGNIQEAPKFMTGRGLGGMGERAVSMPEAAPQMRRTSESWAPGATPAFEQPAMPRGGMGERAVNPDWASTAEEGMHPGAGWEAPSTPSPFGGGPSSTGLPGAGMGAAAPTGGGAAPLGNNWYDKARGFLGAGNANSWSGRALYGPTGSAFAKDPATLGSLALGRLGIAGAGLGGLAGQSGLNAYADARRREAIRGHNRFDLALGALMGGPEGVIHGLHL